MTSAFKKAWDGNVTLITAGLIVGIAVMGINLLTLMWVSKASGPLSRNDLLGATAIIELMIATLIVARVNFVSMMLGIVGNRLRSRPNLATEVCSLFGVISYVEVFLLCIFGWPEGQAYPEIPFWIGGAFAVVVAMCTSSSTSPRADLIPRFEP